MREYSKATQVLLLSTLCLLNVNTASAALVTMNYEAAINTRFLDDGPPIPIEGPLLGQTIRYEIQVETDSLLNPNLSTYGHLYQGNLASFSVELGGLQASTTDGFFRIQDYRPGQGGTIMFYGRSWNETVSGIAQPANSQNPILQVDPGFGNTDFDLTSFYLGAFFPELDPMFNGTSPLSLGMVTSDLTTGQNTDGILSFRAQNGQEFLSFGARNSFTNLTQNDVSTPTANASEPTSLGLIGLVLGLFGWAQLLKERKTKMTFNSLSAKQG